MSSSHQQHLDEETQTNLEKIPESDWDSWGNNGVWNPFDGRYEQKTVVRSGEDAREAFRQYTEYFETVLNSWEPSSNKLVLVPCGSSKPIGSSTLHQKKVQATRDGGLQDADIVILSEPCTVVPPEYRLSVPAANYDFPPKYTVKDDFPRVFEVFTDRLAEWIEMMNYEEIYPYLISGHQSKFEAATEKADWAGEIYEVPSASYNAETGSYSGDRFKTLEDMEQKVRAVLRFKADRDICVEPEHKNFYGDRWGGDK